MSNQKDKQDFLITIVSDSREQIAYSFSERVRAVKAALPAGDYSLLGHETEIAVERKSLADFVSTIILQRDRFREELKKLQTYRAACIVVEASPDDILDHSYSSNAAPAAVWGAAMSIIVDYSIPIYYLKNRAIACKFVEDYLIRFYKKANTLAKAERERKNRNGMIERANDLLPGELRLPLVK